MSQDLEDIKQIFFTECSELLVDMESRLLNLEEGSQDKEQMNAIFRCAHSIKGGAGAFGFSTIMHLTHVAEALLDQFREGKLVPSQASIDTLLLCVDCVTKMLQSIQNGVDPDPSYGKDIQLALQSFIDQASTPVMAAGPLAATPQEPADNEAFAHNTADDVYKIRFYPHRHMLTTGNEPILILRELTRLGDIKVVVDTSQIPTLEGFEALDCYLGWTIELATTVSEADIWEVFEFVQNLATLTIEKQSSQPQTSTQAEIITATVAGLEIASEAPSDQKSDARSEVKATASTATASIRVDLEKVDRLVNMVGEIVITEAMLRAKTRDLPMDVYTDLMKGIDDLSHHTRELQEAVMAVRMQQVKSVFSRMPRIVRDTSSQLGKKIQLVLVGENTEVDKTIIEQLGDPLTHMIRNSVDHGIELPETRLAAGKPEMGTINLSAYHRSGQIIIEIQDDGAGINRDRVLKKAIEKGLVAPESQITDEEIDHLIFHAGFSTAEAVTSVSGRGVGMDVVRKNIESIGGTVRIDNRPGKGSTFSVCLPLTLAILDGMIVRVGSETYIIPITAIIETMRPALGSVKTLQGRGNVINVRGEFIPLIYLDQIFNIDAQRNETTMPLIVLVESGKDKIGLVVDELIGQQQVVIKSLSENADPVRGISGATILGDGKVSLILEINELKNNAATGSVVAA